MSGRGVTDFKKLYNDKLYIPMSYLGFTWLPEMVVNKKITHLSSVIGSGVWAFGFLMSAQLFGLQGITVHSIVYGAGAAGHSLFVVIDNNSK